MKLFIIIIGCCLAFWLLTLVYDLMIAEARHIGFPISKMECIFWLSFILTAVNEIVKETKA